MPTLKELDLVTYESGLGARDPGCADGPSTLKRSPYFLKALSPFSLKWSFSVHQPSEYSSKLMAIVKNCELLASHIMSLIAKKRFFIVLGGDHTSAIGTWSGAASQIRPEGALGLIWIDAHMDSHTVDTSATGNLHGMPLAALLGEGEMQLTELVDKNPKLLPEHVCLIGVRSFEPEEKARLNRLGVRIFYIEEVKQRGLESVLQDALQIATHHTKGFGISIDIDSVDPKDAPGTGVAEPNGIEGKALSEALTSIRNHPNFLGAEIVEFDPHHDKNHKTEHLIAELIKSLIGKNE